jgi:rubredoxin
METVWFKRPVCPGCGFLDDVAMGLLEHGLPAKTRWHKVAEDWVCPECGTPEHQFEKVKSPYAGDALYQRAALVLD